ncbi:hypothetical protein CPB84DRAFT_1231141 [Gymnopilus junonius]|uniref:F-box domain-containing protein n=1 Tax=Gymnopilus junonius TaxID=109634 RepID=A0A9P5NW53_GYMJU|nr:hypothetical protein CPB84DRAFT_1231141 [Gymnopilus junonius]
MRRIAVQHCGFIKGAKDEQRRYPRLKSSSADSTLGSCSHVGLDLKTYVFDKHFTGHSMPSTSISLNDKDVKDWLRSADVMTEDDIPAITGTIQHHEERLESLAIQIDSIINPVTVMEEGLPGFCGIPFNWRIKKLESGPSQLKRLHASQEESRNSIRILNSALAPIRRLPPEVLTEIFRLCLPKEKFIRPSASHAPLLLTQVCSAWRTICISSATLWSSLEIGKPFDIGRAATGFDPNKKDNITALVNMWFSRAGNCPLSFPCKQQYFVQGHSGDTGEVRTTLAAPEDSRPERHLHVASFRN